MKINPPKLLNCTENYNNYYILKLYYVQAQRGTIYMSDFIFYKNSRSEYCCLYFIP